MLNDALYWYDRRFAVFPLKPGMKVPHGNLCPRGLLGASRDERQIREWWWRVPLANIGIVTGDGRFVVDLDGEAGERAWAGLCNNLEVPDTLTVSTGRGRHLFFSGSARSSIARVGPGIDIRSDGGYVVAANSIHPSGAIYTIIGDGASIAPAPAWLIDAATGAQGGYGAAYTGSAGRAGTPAPTGDAWRRAAAPSLAAFPKIFNRVADAREGNRNRTTHWASCRAGEMVAAGLISRELAADLIVEAACKAGLPRGEAVKTVLSGLRNG